MKSQLYEKFFVNGTVEDCPIYDMHGHMGNWYAITFPSVELDEAIRRMKLANVKKLVFCHHSALLAPDIGNIANIEAVKQYPDMLKAYCGINPRYPDKALKDIENMEKNSDIFVGFKFLADYHKIPISEGVYNEAWRYADEKKLLVLLHTWGSSQFDGPVVIEKVAEKYPGAKILMGHSCHGNWSGAIELVKRFPNLYLELCAVLDDRGVLERFVDEVGSDRILFGTDFPWFSYHYYIGSVLGAYINDDARRDIFYRNAQNLLSKFL
ncbi:amidohydrolase family protein [bacterium]|nr:amidohydrolase family protein [bacterium]